MRFLLPILAVLLVTCHAFVPDRDKIGSFEEFADQGGQLVKALEKLKGIVQHGSTKLGIPALDPLKLDHANIDLKQKGLVSVKGTLDNLRSTGLSDYVIEQGDFKIIGLTASVKLLWKQIDLMTLYRVNGTLADKISFFGDGNLALDVRDAEVSVDLKLNANDGKLYVSKLEFHLHVKKFNLRATGLYNDEDLSKVLSAAISDMVPNLIDDYQNELSKYVSPVVANVLNNFLKNYTLQEILDMLKG